MFFIFIFLASEGTSWLAKLRRSRLGPGLPPTRQVRGCHKKRPQHGWRLPLLERLHAHCGQWASSKVSSHVLHSWWAICPWIRQRISWTPIGCKWTGKFFQQNSRKFLYIKTNNIVKKSNFFIHVSKSQIFFPIWILIVLIHLIWETSWKQLKKQKKTSFCYQK